MRGVVLGVDTGRGWMISGGVDKMVRIWERGEIEETLEEDVEAVAGEADVGEKMEGIERSVEDTSDGFLHVPVKLEHSSQV